MLDSSLIDKVQTSWKNWKQTSLSLEPIQDNEYIVLTNRVNDLNNGIAFYLIVNSDGTYTLNDHVLTANNIEKRMGNKVFTNHIHDLASLAGQYGILLSNQGEFINQGIGQLSLINEIDNFTELLYKIVDYSEQVLNKSLNNGK